MAYNVINPEDIEQYFEYVALRYVSEPREVERLKSLFSAALLKPLKKDVRFLEPVTEYPNNPPEWLTPEKFQASTFYSFDRIGSRHLTRETADVIDWIVEANNENVDWIHDVDDKGRPKKLAQIASLEEATQRAQKDKKQRDSVILSHFNHSGGFDEHEKAGHIKTIHRFADGYRVVELRTKASLRLESRILDNCLNKSDYFEKLKLDGHKLFSLRDAQNNPLANMEVIDGALFECEGKSNQLPDAHHLPYLKDFILEHGVNISQFSGRNGFIEQDGQIILFSDIPDNFTIEQSLSFYNNSWLVSLPDSLTINGDLEITACSNFTTPPHDLVVKGNIVWAHPITETPNTLNSVSELRAKIEQYKIDKEALDEVMSMPPENTAATRTPQSP